MCFMHLHCVIPVDFCEVSVRSRVTFRLAAAREELDVVQAASEEHQVC